MAYASVAPGLTHGATYYVAKTGSGTACTLANPCLTVAAGLAKLVAGDTLLISTGTYNETIQQAAVPGGLSPSARTKIKGNAGAQWTLRPTSAAQCTTGSTGSGVIRLISVSNVELSDVIVDANNLCAGGIQVHGTSNDWWIHNVEAKNWNPAAAGFGDGTGISISASGSLYPARFLVQHVYSHDGGSTNQDHCFYLKGDDHVIEHVEGANCSGHGMHMYGGNSTGAKNNRNTVRYSYFHDNGSRGILIGSGDANIAHHNISANNVADGVAIGFNTTTNNKVYNNTIYSNDTDCVEIRAGATGSIVKNNLCLSNTNNVVADGGTGSTVTFNRLSTDTTLVMDVATNRFSPRVGSALIDAGENITGFSSGKFLGVAPDQGALEFAPTTPPTIPGTPTSLQVGASN